MRALWLAGKTDLILCRDLITDVMGMYSMARYVILASAMHLNVLKQFDKLRLVVLFFYILYIALGRRMLHKWRCFTTLTVRTAP